MVIEQVDVSVKEQRVSEQRLRVFSGIQPSGSVHIGNYLGAIRNWVAQQALYDNVFCIVNLHALTLPTVPETLHAETINMTNTVLAAGIDPQQSILFAQSDVPEHTELCWMLSSVTQYGELRRMTQFKDKAGDHAESVSGALFIYPILMAADILLYDTDLVPVGDDQRQHIELTRDVAQRFNTRYGETFVVPRADIKEIGARVMRLDEPAKKMSKSEGTPNSRIDVTDAPDVIRRKVKRAVTDSGTDVRGGADKPALTNLLGLYALFTGISIPDIEERYEGKGYGAFKQDLGDIIVEGLTPIQTRLAELNAQPEIAIRVLAEGAERARTLAAKKMAVVRERMGLALD